MALNNYFQPSEFEFVSAASIGALNTYTYLTNNIEYAQDAWKSVNFQGDKRFVMSVLKSSFLQELIPDIVADTPIATNYYVPLLDLANRELNYYNLAGVSSEDTIQYLRASISMPFYNKGISIGGKTLYDGAVIDNIPIYPILKNDLDYIICIYFDDFNYVFEDHTQDKKIIKLTFPDNKILSNSVVIQHDSIMYMLDEGYRRANRLLSYGFSDGTDNIQSIYSNITKLDAANSNKQLRVTGDVIVTNINKLTQKALRYRRIKN